MVGLAPHTSTEKRSKDLPDIAETAGYYGLLFSASKHPGATEKSGGIRRIRQIFGTLLSPCASRATTEEQVPRCARDDNYVR
jgi:hypothetical protein